MGQREYADYFSSGSLKPEYVDFWADKLAILFGSERLTKSQLRAFFNELKRLETLYRANRDFASIRIKLLSMKAQAHLREKRGNIGSSFREFIQRNVDKTTDPEKLEAFVKHFEAVVAYCEGRLEGGGGR